MLKQIVMSGLNIVIHPHTPDLYLDLFRKLFSLKRPIAIRGTQFVMIGELERVDKEDPLKGISGKIYRFDHIDEQAPWFNVEDHSVAKPDEVAKVNIPKHLKPNLVMFDFVFFPRGHKMYIESRNSTKTLAAGVVKKLLDSISLIPAIVKQFGSVEVTVLPDKESLETILRIHRLTKLVIDVKRPNPDDLGEKEDVRVFRRFKKMNTRRLEQVLTAEPGETIKPDEDIQLLARVASTNGKVHAVGYSSLGQRVEESTVNRPWKHTIEYDTDAQIASDAFLQAAQEEHANL